MAPHAWGGWWCFGEAGVYPRKEGREKRLSQEKSGRGCLMCPAIISLAQAKPSTTPWRMPKWGASSYPCLYHLNHSQTPYNREFKRDTSQPQLKSQGRLVPRYQLFISTVRNIICIYRHFIQVPEKKKKRRNRKKTLTTSSSPDQQLLSQTHNKCSVPKLNTQERCNMAAHTFTEAVNK